MKVQDSGAWEFIKVPNPVHVGRDYVTCQVLKTWIMSQLALPGRMGGIQLINSPRLFRNDGGKAKDNELRPSDIVWKNLWYLVILDTMLEPLREYPDHESPDSLIGG